jgi:hypothetical protein
MKQEMLRLDIWIDEMELENPLTAMFVSAEL